MLKIINIVGARPNFMKVAALHRAFSQRDDLHSRILHTGQHYDEKMSDVFFRQLGMPEPHVYLGVGSGSHAEQTARIMMDFEKSLTAEQPDVVVVVGDVNSTLACSLVCAKMGVPVVHVEAGLRSFDWTMPEEINRVVTDRLCELLFVSEPSGLTHLAAEGVPPEKVHFVGNVMIDSLIHFLEKARGLDERERLGLDAGGYVLMTMHRPANVDDPEMLTEIVRLLHLLSEAAPVVFPLHPRTRAHLRKFGFADQIHAIPNLHLAEPFGYLEFLHLMDQAGVLVTDSGGVQEETTYLGVPCITLRPNTERPVTMDEGTNELMDLDAESVAEAARRALSGNWKQGRIPEKWDGHAAERTAEILAAHYGE